MSWKTFSAKFDVSVGRRGESSFSQSDLREGTRGKRWRNYWQWTQSINQQSWVSVSEIHFNNEKLFLFILFHLGACPAHKPSRVSNRAALLGCRGDFLLPLTLLGSTHSGKAYHQTGHYATVISPAFIAIPRVPCNVNCKCALVSHIIGGLNVLRNSNVHFRLKINGVGD